MGINRLRAAITTALLLISPSLLHAEVVNLDCNVGGLNDRFSLDLNDMSVKLFLNHRVTLGTLSVEEHNYTVRLPKTESQFESLILIDRFSGRLLWKHGSEPLGVGSIRLGTCKKGSDVPLF